MNPAISILIQIATPYVEMAIVEAIERIDGEPPDEALRAVHARIKAIEFKSEDVI